MIKAAERRRGYILWRISREIRFCVLRLIRTELMTMSHRFLIGCLLMVELDFMLPTGEADLEGIFTETAVLMAVLISLFLLQESFMKVLKQAVPLYVFTDN